MASNYPAGVTDAMIDELVGDDYEPEPTEEALEGEYLDRIEQEAAALAPEWTDEDIAAYEVWLERIMRLPRIPRRMPAEWEEAA